MAAGRKVYSVQFQRATLGTDGFGTTETWAAHGSPVLAEKIDVSDAERFRAQEVAAHITARFRVPASALTIGITPKDRLVCRGRTYDISGIKEVERDRELEITAAARTDL
jgi:head-tail adaptor